MGNVVVVGAQWGDEGKGKLVDWLSEQADTVVRFQGGHNAGHTLVIGDKTYKLSLLPSGVVRPHKLGVIGNLIGRVDRLLIGGGMAYTFLAAQGYGVGTSLLEADQVDTVKGFIAQARERGVELLVPVDIVVADVFAADAATEVVPADAIPDGWMGLDIGPATRELFASRISDAGTVVWNGPMGVFEMDAFAKGTVAVAQAVAAVNGTAAPE
mgnify:CR=1 FL=1